MKKILLLFSGLVLSQALAAQLTFTTLTSGTSERLLGVTFADASTGYACGKSGTVVKTTDGGASWTLVATGTVQDLWDIKVMPGSAGTKVIAGGANNTMMKSVDGGQTWVSQTIPFQAGSFVFGLQCFDTLNYIGCGGDYGTFTGAILRTTDGGANWTKTTVTSSFFLDKVHMTSLSYGFTAGTNTSFTDGGVQKTSNTSSWTVVKQSPNLLTNVWCNSNANIVSVGLAGQIWKSTNAGSTWTSHGFNTTDLYGIQFKDSLNGFACGGDNASSIILRTTNGGNTWNQIPYSFNSALNALCIQGNDVYVVGDLGTIIKTSLPVVVATGIPSLQNEIIAELYPNPGSDKINFRVTGVTEAKIVISDINGKTQTTVSVNHQDTEIHTASLSRGIYFYAFVSGEQILKRGKLILE